MLLGFPAVDATASAGAAGNAPEPDAQSAAPLKQGSATRPKDWQDAPTDPEIATASNDDTSESESTGSLVIDEAVPGVPPDESPASPESTAASEKTSSSSDPGMERRISLDTLDAIAVSTKSMDASKSSDNSDGTSAFDRWDVKRTLATATDSDASGRGSARAPGPKKVRRAGKRPIVGSLSP
ncbi:hypothetical protein IscW_ISCW011214 [Ixodes scapularis]|uniref:Uncharacterized protein n=1 Tax=Ixodes scapularis TaxID=6945 RepID=B7Q477_IXOSC|nr:hypothetical protein IscW_ISCW011214 [Ixodes scapularis]|eukprot:XP_002411494.1 hypothetical protein IscW_ISCW011214 [Ixodes scapularis]